MNAVNAPDTIRPIWRRAIALKYDETKTTPVLARALAQQGKYQDVLDATEKVTQTADVLALRGSAYLGLGKGDEAKAAFDVSRRDPQGSPSPR